MAIEWTPEEAAIVASNRARLEELWREPYPMNASLADVIASERDAWIAQACALAATPCWFFAVHAETASREVRLIVVQVALFLTVQACKRL